jgi:hypothetical protein
LGMTRKESNRTISEIKAIMAEDGDFLRPMVRAVIQEFLEAEMAEAVGAEKGERAGGRLSYRSGYYPRSLITATFPKIKGCDKLKAIEPLANLTGTKEPERLEGDDKFEMFVDAARWREKATGCTERGTEGK